MKNKKILIFIISNLFIVSLVGISAYGTTIEDEKELRIWNSMGNELW